MAALMEYLTQAVQMDASDLFIVPGGAVSIKLDGQLMPIGEEKIMPPQGKELIREIYALAERDMEPFLQTGDEGIDLAHREGGPPGQLPLAYPALLVHALQQPERMLHGYLPIVQNLNVQILTVV